MAAASFPFSQNHQPLLNRFEPVDPDTNAPGWLPVYCPISFRSTNPAAVLSPDVPQPVAIVPFLPVVEPGLIPSSHRRH